MSRFGRRALLGIALGALLYAIAIIWFDARSIVTALRGFPPSAMLIALALSTANYGLRFWKWELCLRWLGVRSPGPHGAPDLTTGRSLQIYLAGLSMSVTPGKIGEVLRSVLLRASDRVPFARTAPVVVADRLSDVLALILLTLVGLTGAGDTGVWFATIAAASLLVLSTMAIFGSPARFGALLRSTARVPGLRRASDAALGMVESAALVLRPRSMFWLTSISVIGWALECVGYWTILKGFGFDVDPRLCACLWAGSTLIGALSFLPGGLGAAEASLGVLALRAIPGLGEPVAVASTLLIRAATLWWGELVGAAALLSFLRDPHIRARAGEADLERAGLHSRE